MPRTIPEEIVAALGTLAEELAAWCGEGRDATLEEHAGAVLARVQAVLPALLRAVVEAATSGLDPRLARARAACPGCGGKRLPHQIRRRDVHTKCGAVTLVRPWYTCARCRHGWSVVETTLGVPRRQRVSAGLQAWLVRVGATTDYREASGVVAELTGLAVSPATIRRQCVRVGTALAAADDAAIVRTQQTRESAEPVDSAPGLLVLEADGALLHYTDGWHEVKLGRAAGWDGDALLAPSYVAAREPAERFGRRLATEAARRGALEAERWAGGITGRGLAILRPAALLGAGAAWIWNLADEYVDQRIEIVDFYHAAEHRATAAHALVPDPETATAWLTARRAELLSRGVAPVLAAFDAIRPATPEVAAVRRTERAYFATHAERMDYPTLRLDGLPIGSGPTESAADHLLHRRMKRAGMRWSPTGGRAMLTLRARLRSNRPLAA